VALSGVEGAIGGDGGDLLQGWDLVEQLGQHGRVADVSGGELGSPNLQCRLVDTTFLVGGTVLVMPAFKARTFLELAAAERMTYALLVPTMYNLRLLDLDFARLDLSQWRIAGFGGAPMPARIERLACALPGLHLATLTARPTPPRPARFWLLARSTTVRSPSAASCRAPT